MRIERVVGGSFNEASERSRQLFGPSVMLISSARVGDIHELLVCTDTADAEESKSPAKDAARGDFAATLSAELVARTSHQRPVPRVVPTVLPPEPMVVQPRDDQTSTYQGAALVGAIRRELLALENRLAGKDGPVRGLAQKVSLLEHGLTAAYATRLLETGLDGVSVSRRLLDDLAPAIVDDVLGSRPLLLVGPSAGGKTTAAMQATHLVAARRGVSPVVSAVRDPRPGAREHFFAIADAAKTVSSWGGVAEGSLVIDGGAYSTDDLQSRCAEFSGFDICLCIPAYLNRTAAARWLDCAIPIRGVIITHWSDTEVPLGLLAALAERQRPLLGLSVSADPALPLVPADAADIAAAMDRVMALVLATDIPGSD